MNNFNNPPARTKTCLRCGDTKRLNQFQKRAGCRDGHSCTCNACRYAASEEKTDDIRAMFDDLMYDPEAKELLKGLNGYGGKI